MIEELVDILDELGNLTGVKKTKKQAHNYGLWHSSSHIWIYNSKSEVLLQKRSINKDVYPSLWDISAAGHILAGERPIDAALREINEEVGIKVKDTDLKFVGIRKITDSNPKINWYNNEFDYAYLLRFDGDISKLRLEENEVECIKFVPIDKVESELKDPQLRNMYTYTFHQYLDVFEIIRKEINKTL